MKINSYAGGNFKCRESHRDASGHNESTRFCRRHPPVEDLLNTFSRLVPLFCNLKNLSTIVPIDEEAILDQLI